MRVLLVGFCPIRRPFREAHPRKAERTAFARPAPVQAPAI
jgi:hypothetical protein